MLTSFVGVPLDYHIRSPASIFSTILKLYEWTIITFHFFTHSTMVDSYSLLSLLAPTVVAQSITKAPFNTGCQVGSGFDGFFCTSLAINTALNPCPQQDFIPCLLVERNRDDTSVATTIVTSGEHADIMQALTVEEGRTYGRTGNLGFFLEDRDEIHESSVNFILHNKIDIETATTDFIYNLQLNDAARILLESSPEGTLEGGRIQG
jgi:hypothetical protein